MHGLGADYISIALAAIRERKHKLFQLLATNGLVSTKTKLDARLVVCAAQRDLSCSWSRIVENIASSMFVQHPDGHYSPKRRWASSPPFNRKNNAKTARRASTKPEECPCLMAGTVVSCSSFKRSW